MSDASYPSTQSTIQAFSAIREDKLARLLSRWLGIPGLEEVVLVSFAFNPRLKNGDGPLARKLELLASSTTVTLITALPQGTEAQNVHARNQRSVFRGLVVAGVRVLIHDTLHAKVYLFRRGDKVCWVVGSSNLTHGGLSGNTEINVAGYRIADYREVLSQVEEIIDGAYPV